SIAGGASYHERVGLCVRSRPQHRDLQLPEPAVMRKTAAGPRPKHDRLGFIKARLRLVMVDAKTLVVVNVVGAAATEPNDEPPFEDIVEQRHLLGEPDRMVQRGLEHGEA